MIVETLHEKATPLTISTGAQVGWIFSNGYFEYAAFEHEGRIKVYVEWGDDMPEDEIFFPNWQKTRDYLDMLLQSSHH
jgi:hypothetical protein